MNKLKELMKKFGEMKKAHKLAIIISAILLAVVLVVSIVLLVSCGGGSGTQQGGHNTGSDDSNAPKETYTVSVKTQGGMVMSDLDIYVYADTKLTDLKDYKSTDDNGITAPFTYVTSLQDATLQNIEGKIVLVHNKLINVKIYKTFFISFYF